MTRRAVVLAALAAVVAATPGAAGAPVAPTGLRLLVADVPAPYVLDVDRGTIERVHGLAVRGERGVGVTPLGRHALVVSIPFCAGCTASEVYVVRYGELQARRLGRALQAIPSRDGRGVWLFTRGSARRCAVRQVGLDGRPRRGARPVSCRTGLVAELPAGLLVNFSGPLGRDAHASLLTPDGRAVRVGSADVQPVVRNLVVSAAGERTLVLRSVVRRSGLPLRRPGRAGYSLGDVAGGPTGRLAVVELAKYSPDHRVDLWLLDAATRRWRQLPGMPAALVPKVTDLGWTADGRVVILSGDWLGVWRPGASRLSMRRVPAAKRPGGGFVVWSH